MKMCVLLTTLLIVACGNVQIIPTNAHRRSHDPRVEHIMQRLLDALEPKQQSPKINYVVWTSQENGLPIAVDASTRTIYIDEVVLALSDSALAFSLGHEIGHIVEPGIPKLLMGVGSIGSSIAGGVLVGQATQWYWGLLAGGGIYAFVSIPILLFISRDKESDADAFGLRLMAKAGFDSTRAVNEWCALFSVMENDDGEFQRTGNGTHPNATARCRHLQTHLAQIP